ncbi:MAG TPA: S-layer homology domain-containing protein [Syntrophomonadaceae bacterium]|nr:S-layer homology domain-containing protein [Syntrophomonadaceae bacterium]
MKKNKTIALLVMLMFALTFIAPVTYASTLNDVPGMLEEQLVPGYPDIHGHWAEQTINKMLGKEITTGYPDGTFKPDNSITRAEFATIVAKAFELEAKPGKVFADTEKHWAKDTISIVAAHGISSGYSDKEFGPDDFITREQMTVMAVKAAKLTELINKKTFADSQNISDWAKDSVDLAVGNDLITGYPDNTFKPKGNASRAEAAVVLYKSMSLKLSPDLTVVLTEDELSYFNGDLFFNRDYLNIHNQFLSSLYDEPADIDLFELFYCGSGISETMTDDELKAVMAKSGMTGSIEELPCGCEKNSRSNMDQILTECMGIRLADTNEVGLDNFIYLPQYDAYYHLHGDTNYRINIKFSRGEHEGNLIRLFYNDTFSSGGDRVLTLEERNGEYLFVSHQKVSNKEVTGIGNSTQFTKEEINAAIKVVKDNFSFPASTLTKVWYNEENSDKITKIYLENGKGAGSGIEPENVMVLLSNFYVDDSGDNPVLNPDSTYTDYQWILIRDDKTSDWKVDDWGY